MPEKKLSPWLYGVVDTLVGAEVLRASTIPNRNRLAVILIDSAFETACRAFLQHKAKIKLQETHRHRDNLISAVKAKLPHIDEQVWDDINYYYQDIRCDFYHQSASKTIVDVALLDYRDTVRFVIDEAFGVDTSPLIETELAKTAESKGEGLSSDRERSEAIRVTEVDSNTDKLLVAVAAVLPHDVSQVNDYFKKEGEPWRLKQPEFRQIVAQNSGSKKYFYFDKQQKVWSLSALGKFKLAQLIKGEAHVE
jgi:hypothetical protein